MSTRPVVIISGASSGIGRAAALEFSRNGYDLSLSGRNAAELSNTVEECEKLGAKKIISTIGDLRESAVAEDFVNHTVGEFGKIDTLINAAGVLVNGTVEESDLTDYDKVFDVNVRSVIQLTKLSIPYLVKTRGSIVNVSSVAGVCAFGGVSYYCMSKAALDQFTKCLALELAPKGVRVNAVNPGVIVTDIHKRAGMSDVEYKQFLEKGKQTHAMGRVGTADEVAKGIYFLASSQSSFTTGLLLLQDGGRSLMTPR